MIRRRRLKSDGDKAVQTVVVSLQHRNNEVKDYCLNDELQNSAKVPSQLSDADDAGDESDAPNMLVITKRSYLAITNTNILLSLIYLTQLSLLHLIL